MKDRQIPRHGIFDAKIINRNLSRIVCVLRNDFKD
jgi:hypothetical protein